MVSFQCDACCDVVKKPKLDQHRQRCWATFTCIDCSTTFQNNDYKSHTSCISEAEKYEKSVYKGPKKGKNGKDQKAVNGNNQSQKPSQPQSIVAEIKEKKKEPEAVKESKDKKRKKVEEKSDSSSSSSSESESESEEENEKPKKKAKLTVWSDIELCKDLHDNILLAIPAVLSKSTELTLKDVRKKVVKKITGHSKNKAKKDDIKEAFESLKVVISKDGRICMQ